MMTMTDELTSPMELEPDYAPAPDPDLPPPLDPEREVARRAEEESMLSAVKRRVGGKHSNPLPGEVGPCTRCGWVWTPDYRTTRSRPEPKRCANCRSDYWQLQPVRPNARRPNDPEWATRRDTIKNRKHRRKVARIQSLAEELGVELTNVPVEPRKRRRRRAKPELPPLPEPVSIDMTPRLPWQRTRPAIPPPPGMDAEDSE